MNYDETSPVRVARGVYHLGVPDPALGWANLPYLVREGDTSALIDPGSAAARFRRVVRTKLLRVGAPRTVRHIIVQHQDPDLCAGIPFVEGLLHPEVEVICPAGAVLAVQHYGFKSPLRGVEDDDVLELPQAAACASS